MAVWGLGPIGLCALKWAKIKGAKRVIGIDRVPARLEIAKTLCGAEVINFDEVSDIPAKLLEMTGGRGVDVALDCGTCVVLPAIRLSIAASTSPRACSTRLRSSSWCARG